MMGFSRPSALDYFRKLQGNINMPTGDAPHGETATPDGKRIYWYIFSFASGKRVFAGPYDTREQATAAAQEKMSGWSFRVLGLPTRDRAAAIQMVKHDIARGGAISQALQAMRHTV